MAGSKRSAVVGLSLIGAYLGVSYYLGSYQRNDAVAADLFTNPQQCAASGRYDRAQCDNAYAEASRVNQQSAPRYKSLADCEADFSPGACDRVPPTSAVSTAPTATLFAPVMAGFVIGGAAAALATPAAQPVYRSCAGQQDPRNCISGSVASGATSRFFTGAGYSVTSTGSGSSVSISRSAFSASASSATLSRGGFGARAASISARA